MPNIQIELNKDSKVIETFDFDSSETIYALKNHIHKKYFKGDTYIKGESIPGNMQDLIVSIRRPPNDTIKVVKLEPLKKSIEQVLGKHKRNINRLRLYLYERLFADKNWDKAKDSESADEAVIDSKYKQNPILLISLIITALIILGGFNFYKGGRYKRTKK